MSRYKDADIEQLYAKTDIIYISFSFFCEYFAMLKIETICREVDN